MSFLKKYISFITDVPQYLRVLVFCSLAFLSISLLWSIGVIYFLKLLALVIVVEVLFLTLTSILHNMNSSYLYLEEMSNMDESDLKNLIPNTKYTIFDKLRSVLGTDFISEFKLSDDYINKEEVLVADTVDEIHRLYRVFCNLNIAFSSLNTKFVVDRVFIKHPVLEEYFVLYIENKELILLHRLFYIELNKDGYTNIIKMLIAIFSFKELIDITKKELSDERSDDKVSGI